MAWVRNVFKSAFSRYLLLTNTIGTGVIDGLGDYLEQHIERATEIDWERTKRMAIIGLIFGPIGHYWYKYLDRKLPGKTTATLVKKIVYDEVVLGTASIVIFFVGKIYLWGVAIV